MGFGPWCSQHAERAPPLLLRHRSAKWFILVTICVAVVTDLFLYSIVVPVIPFALSQRVGIPEDEVQRWVAILLAVYGAALLAACPICGWLADKSPSRRLPLLFGLLALAGATLMLCLGTSIAVLVTGRVLQGFAAAVVWVVGLALLVDTVGEQEIGQAMGYVFISCTVGFGLGPLLGGVVYEKAGYYAVFYVSFGLIVLDVVLRFALVEKKVARRWMLDDDPQANTVEVRISDTESSREKATLSNSTLPAASQAAPVSAPLPTEEPSIPTTKHSSLPPVLTLLSSRRLLAALWGSFVQATLMSSFDSVLPLRVHALFSWTSTGAGILYLALVLPTLVSPLVGYLSDKYGPRWLTVFGFSISALNLIFLRFVNHNSIGQIALLCALLALLGVGLMFAITPLLAEITYVVEAKEKKSPGIYGAKGAYAQAYALFNASYAAGTLVGPLWAGFVVQDAGWGTMSWSLAVLSAVSAVPAGIWTGGLVTRRHGVEGRWARSVESGDANGVEGRV